MTNEEILRVYKGISDLNEKNIPLNIKTSYIKMYLISQYQLFVNNL